MWNYGEYQLQKHRKVVDQCLFRKPYRIAIGYAML